MVHACTVINPAAIQDNIPCVRYTCCLIGYSKIDQVEIRPESNILGVTVSYATGCPPFYCSTQLSDVHSMSNNNAPMSTVCLNQILRHSVDIVKFES